MLKLSALYRQFHLREVEKQVYSSLLIFELDSTPPGLPTSSSTAMRRTDSLHASTMQAYRMLMVPGKII